MGDVPVTLREEAFAHFVERSGLVVHALLDGDGNVVRANTPFGSLFDITMPITESALLGGDTDWAEVAADVADGGHPLTLTSSDEVRVTGHLYPADDGLVRLIGVHSGNDQLMTRVSTDLASFAFSARRDRRRLAGEAKKADLAANHDQLTGLPNRRRLDALAADFDRTGEPLSVGLLDIDHFKSVNDTFGHDEGDAVLAAVAAAAASACRPGDTIARFGGEEFALLLPAANEAEASVVAERLRVAISSEVTTPDGTPVTVSIGVSRRGEGETVAAALQRADEALYRAKRAGRNRVEAG